MGASGRHRKTSLRLAFARGRVEAAARAHAFSESFPLLGSHRFPALGYTTAEPGARADVASQSSEKDPAQRQNAEPLPERDHAPAEKRRRQPIPQPLNNCAAERDEPYQRQNRQRSNPKPFLPSHVSVPRFVNSS